MLVAGGYHCSLQPRACVVDFKFCGIQHCVIVEADLDTSKIGHASMSVSDFNAMYGRELNMSGKNRITGRSRR